jgi:tetrahydromethanopterin S-methyltransferase subunit G
MIKMKTEFCEIIGTTKQKAKFINHLYLKDRVKKRMIEDVGMVTGNIIDLLVFMALKILNIEFMDDMQFKIILFDFEDQLEAECNRIYSRRGEYEAFSDRNDNIYSMSRLDIEKVFHEICHVVFNKRHPGINKKIHEIVVMTAEKEFKREWL